MDATNSMLRKPVIQKTLDAKEGGLALKRHKQLELQVQPLKKCRVTENTLRHQECNLWENLDSNILEEILSHMTVQDVFLNVSSVCQSWEAVCWDYLFWSRNVLDLSITGAGVGSVDISDAVSLSLFEDDEVPGIFKQLHSAEKYKDMATCLMRKLRRVMEGQNICNRPLQSWSESIDTIILPYEFGITDKYLLYIAERTPCLERLFLMCPSKITVSGFTRAIQNWQYVTEIHIGPLDDNVFVHFIEEMGRNFEELETLHIHQKGFLVDQTSAQMIAKRLPGLKKIGFELGHVRPSGVTTLYKMCLQLEEMQFDSCQMKPDLEVPLYLEEFYPKVTGMFRLTWTVHDTGYALWEVEPNPITIKDCEKIFESFGLNKEYNVHDMLTPEYIKYKRSMYQSEFEEWIWDATVSPRRPLDPSVSPSTIRWEQIRLIPCFLKVEQMLDSLN